MPTWIKPSSPLICIALSPWKTNCIILFIFLKSAICEMHQSSFFVGFLIWNIHYYWTHFVFVYFYHVKFQIYIFIFIQCIYWRINNIFPVHNIGWLHANRTEWTCTEGFVQKIVCVNLLIRVYILNKNTDKYLPMCFCCVYFLFDVGCNEYSASAFHNLWSAVWEKEEQWS